MEKNLKLFLIIFLLSLPFWLGVNIFQKNFEDFLLSRIIENNPPSFFIAEISKHYPNPRDLKMPQILAESALSVKIDKNGNQKIIFKKEEGKKMAIASLTKLMTAVIALEFYEPSQRVKISRAAVSQPEEAGKLKVGEILTVRDLLYIMLIESSNDAAFSLAEIIGIAPFTSLMNLKAKELGMENTFFFNPTGLDPEGEKKGEGEGEGEGEGWEKREEGYNFSTAEDLVKLVKYILKQPLILEILSKKEYPLRLENGVLHHILYNTNTLLWEIPEAIGGKTGFTEKAGGCLVLILKEENSEDHLINVILNSTDRFQDMKQLINYAK